MTNNEETTPNRSLTFQEKLDEQLFGKKTVRKFLKEIYRTAIKDREDAKQLFQKIKKDYKKTDDNPEINFLPAITSYMKLMKNSTDQLIEIGKIVERLANSSSKVTEAQAKQALKKGLKVDYRFTEQG